MNVQDSKKEKAEANKVVVQKFFEYYRMGGHQRPDRLEEVKL